MKRLGFGAVLVVVWVLLWDAITWGQALAGIAVAGGLMVVLRSAPAGLEPRLTVRPLPLVRLLAWFSWQMLLSIFYVVRAVLFPGRWVNPGIVHVDLRATSPTLAALVSNITALTPGMQPVDGTPDGSALEVHVLSLGTEAGVRKVVWRLEDLVLAAFDRETSTGPLHARTPSPRPHDPTSEDR
jgi:multicomponent Na+:H+ antiporter subunit E